jgi:uncharacterized protein
LSIVLSIFCYNAKKRRSYVDISRNPFCPGIFTGSSYDYDNIGKEMKRLEVRFTSSGLSLEGVVNMPDGPGPFPAVIVCHPHPLYGGNLDNNVVYHISQALAKNDFIALRFNFRGVEGSQGHYDNGKGEQQDVAAAVSYVTTLNETDSGNVGLAGYSAGASYSMPIGLSDERVKAIAAVSPVITTSDFSYLRQCFKPKLMILGDQDYNVLGDRFLEFCGKLPEPKESYLVPGVDHYWWGYESILTEKITPFFNKTLKCKT